MSDLLPESFSPLQSIRSLLENSVQLRDALIQLPAGTTILYEGQENASVYILLEGEVILQKQDEKGNSVQIDHFTPGAFLGLTSFWSGTRSFVRSVCLTPVECLRLDRKAFDRQMQAGEAFGRSLQTLFIDNLSERYRRMVSLNLKVLSLSQELEQERNQLRVALQNLEEAQGRLVHQEKLATLGQLVAGIAHEINNPCAALVSSSAQLAETIEALLGQITEGKARDECRDLFHAGLQSGFVGAEEKRRRIAALQERFPSFTRPFVRRLAALPQVQLNQLLLPVAASEVGLSQQWERQLPFYEAGLLLHSVQLSGKRISDLVLSLKNYGRRGGEMKESVDLTATLHDTLRVLKSRLQPYRVHLELHPLPPVWINAGEISQVWTNILVNAVDAMTDRGDRPDGEIWITAQQAGQSAQVQIADSGPGIAAADLERIFDTNFTTKNSSKSFGLGLGLTISRNIITKNGGTLSAANRQQGGAVFTIKLPLKA